MKLFKLKRKNIILVSLLAIAGFLGISSVAVNQAVKDTPVAEKAEAATNRTLKLHYNAAGDNTNWETLAVLYGHDNQYECVVYLEAGSMFGFQVFNGSSQSNWIGYKSNLSSTYFQSSSGSDGGNIKIKSGQGGVYSFYISSDIDNYGGPADGYWIWQNNKSGGTKLSDNPAYVLGSIKGDNKWATSTTDYPFAWDSSTNRYKATLDLYEGDEIKIYRPSDGRYTGYAAALSDSSSGSYGYISDTGYKNNISISKKGRFSIYLGASYNFYGDAEAGWIADPSSDTSGKNYYFSYITVVDLYDVTISNANPGYGSIDTTSIIDVPSGSSISVSSNKVTINGTTVTATPTAATAQYTYAFSSWSNASGTITADRTITANFTRTTNTYTVSFAVNTAGYGTVSDSSIASVPYGSAISVSGNKVTINGTTITATPSAATAQYTYAFSGWSNTSGTVTGARTITANFTRTTNTYTVTFNKNNDSYGTISGTSIASIPYGSSITVSDNKVTINGTTITATPAAATAQYTYAFSGWSNTSGTVTGARTITANFTRTTNTYTVTFNKNNDSYGTISGTSIASIPYGSSITVSDNKVTINGTTITATPAAATAQYTYAFSGWSNTSGTVTGARTITANFTRTTNTYTVTFNKNNDSYGSLSRTTITSIPYGTSVSVSSNTVTINGTTVTATAASDANGYHYSFSSWSNAPATITGAVTITANFSATSGEAAAITYAKAFNTSISSVCVYAGGTSKSDLADAWSDQNDAYDLLDGYVQYWLNKSHASTDSNVLGMFAKYDYVYGKYGEEIGEDFLNREPAPVLGLHSSPFDLFGSEDNFSTIIIIVSSSVALLSVTALSILVIRKRKSKED